MDVVLDNFGGYVDATVITVELTLLSFAVAFVVGVLVAAFRVSPVPPLRTVATLWVEALRNTPVIVLMYLFFFGLTKVGVSYSPFVSAVIVLAAYTSTFVAETVRSGINSVSRGQAEAGRALGLTFPQLLVLVVLPQALRTVVAPLGSVFIALIKNSAIAGAFAVLDIFGFSKALLNADAPPIATLVGAAVAYLVLALPAGWGVGFIERRVAIRR
ncbi:MAG TPA: amino acid ABC transporter permease [Acidimicrobiales bacterium]|jgi:glutamate transport system permease protein|nr:amino acid ABC transporter permease [Acidimicrobiales bacterium]